MTHSSFIDTSVVFAESRKTIPDDLWNMADKLAAENDADATLIRAVMLTENLQRPRWFRRLERIGARMIRKDASLGILQVPGNPEDTEADLMARAVEERFTGVIHRSEDQGREWVLELGAAGHLRSRVQPRPKVCGTAFGGCPGGA